MKKPILLYGPSFYSGMAMLFLALFVVNVCSRGTALGLIGTGGLAILTGLSAYRAWVRRRRMERQQVPLTSETT
ncbi:hypothetical protein A5647_03535 [Mycobacterium sp. 1100029.7]|nr:hypothetical protein A5647_03535 [Mycobacterium sp. 1100029.7]